MKDDDVNRVCRGREVGSKGLINHPPPDEASVREDARLSSFPAVRFCIVPTWVCAAFARSHNPLVIMPCKIPTFICIVVIIYESFESSETRVGDCRV
jgi:hypothetical protein